MAVTHNLHFKIKIKLHICNILRSYIQLYILDIFRRHYYTKSLKSFAQHFQKELGGGWPGCPPRLFEARQQGQQLPRLMLINRGGRTNATASANQLTEVLT
jgi:hypothetical protein